MSRPASPIAESTRAASSNGASPAQPDVVAAAMEAAAEAGLRYVRDTSPGIRRRRRGQHFEYRAPGDSLLRDDEELGRIKALAIPPAWTDVWICPSVRGHIQATGRDARGRKQYRYHARWRQVRDETKYHRMISFGRTLPRIRRATHKDLGLPGLPRRKVLAAVVRLLEATLIRIGNDEYARSNNSFGLTTLRDRHVRIQGRSLQFQFLGKGGKAHATRISDRRLATVVKRCQDLPGQVLFQYLDEDGEQKNIESGDVNEYLREISGHDFTAKDFRTWAGTVLAAAALQEFEAFDSEAQAKRHVVRAIEAVAERLGNTPTVCRKCYVHPAVVEAYLDGTMVETLKARAESELGRPLARLEPGEAAVLGLLQQRLKREQQGRNGRTRRD